MISKFLNLIGRLRVFDSMFGHQLFQDKDWLFDENQKLC